MLNEVKHLIRFLTYVRNDKKEEKKPLPATQYSHLQSGRVTPPCRKRYSSLKTPPLASEGR